MYILIGQWTHHFKKHPGGVLDENRFIDEFVMASLQFLFGLNSKVHNNVLFVDENKVIYPSGHSVNNCNTVAPCS